MQEIIVGIIVLGALIYLVARYRRIYKGKGGCSCQSCPRNVRDVCSKKNRE